MRRTKIVATIGPSTDTPASIEKMLAAGVDVVRMNFSHGEAEDHIKRAHMVREAANRLGRIVAILGDLQGPKIRIERFKEDKITINDGDTFILDSQMNKYAGTHECVGIAYKELPNDVVAGDDLLLDDGRIVLQVVRVTEQKIYTKVVVGGVLSNNKGINKRGGGISAEALSEKDKADIKIAAEIGVDFLAVSFPRSADDLHQARALLKDAGGKADIVSKIERAEAILQPVLDEIIDASDVIMVARGDLGVEVGDSSLPSIQKDLIKRARSKNCVVITATQMMETMIENTIPTRAEVFDVANAVMDGTDAVMLSGETAVGKHPSRVVEAMADICVKAEKSSTRSKHRLGDNFTQVDECIAMSTMYAANHMDVKGIGTLTESGSTPLYMSRISSGIPIYAMTTHQETCRKVAMYRGVFPVWLNQKIEDSQQANEIIVKKLIEDKVVAQGDIVIVTRGDLMGRGSDGSTNQMKVIRVGDRFL